MFQPKDAKNRPLFFELIDQLYSMLATVGVVRPQPSTDVVRLYNELTPDYRVEIESRVQSQIDLLNQVLTAASKEGFSALGDVRATWAGLRHLKLRPPSSLFSEIKDGDIVEIYDFNGVQIFRNFTVLKHTSYSLEDIFLNSFESLYMRDESIIMKCWKFTERVLEINGPVAADVEEHLISERLSQNPMTSRMKFNVLSPVYGTADNAVAILITSRAKILNA